MYIQIEYTWYTTPKYQSYFGMIFHKKNPSETWTHPPTSLVNTDFWKKNLCKAPNAIIRA